MSACEWILKMSFESKKNESDHGGLSSQQRLSQYNTVKQYQQKQDPTNNKTKRHLNWCRCLPCYNHLLLFIFYSHSHSDPRAGFLHSQISQKSPINPPEISFSTQITQWLFCYFVVKKNNKPRNVSKIPQKSPNNPLEIPQNPHLSHSAYS